MTLATIGEAHIAGTLASAVTEAVPVGISLIGVCDKRAVVDIVLVGIIVATPVYAPSRRIHLHHCPCVPLSSLHVTFFPICE